ncbi:SDR family oxidoreductase [bacterium]|nr:SDR family oxidoreductase [bacterium]
MNETQLLSGKTILVTGASAGLGKACAERIARLGGRVVLVARNGERLRAVCESLEGEGHTFFSQDITDYPALTTLVDRSAENGPVYGFIHSAGMEITLPLRNMRSSDYESLFAVNVIAGFELARLLCAKKVRDAAGGSYIFISSTMGLVGQSGLVGYCASKGALVSGVRAMAAELSSKNIRVNCVCPGHVEGTPMSDHLFATLTDEAKSAISVSHPLGLGTPEDVAHACVYLLSDQARWVTGTALSVDGGYTMV